MQRKIIIAETVEAMNRQAVELLAERAGRAIVERGRFTIALSGGHAVRTPYEMLAAAPGIDWSKVFVFWGDDRFVEHGNPYSNYQLAEQALLSRLPSLPRENVFPVPVDAPHPAEGARRYGGSIREFFGLAEGEWPRFDLAQNGLGPDGHTASLFPRSEALRRHDQIAVMNHAGLAPWVDRVTLTLPVFNHARCVLFLAAGTAKAAILKQVLEGPHDVEQWPAQGIQPEDGELIWLLDAEIAAGLSR